MKHRKGCLVKRGNAYSVRLSIDKTVIVRALHTPDGQPCRTLVEARRAQAVETREIALLDRKQALESAIRKLSSVNTELESLRAPKAKIAEAWRGYMINAERPNSGPHTLANYERHTRDFADWIKASHPSVVYLADVSKALASAYSRHLSQTYSGHTHNKNISFLRLLFRTLVEGEKNPFDRIRPQPKETVKHEALSIQQVQSVLAKAHGELNTFLLVGVYTCLRRKDACLLRWEQVDLDKGVITVMPSKTASRSGKIVSIPIHPALKTRLETLFRNGDYVMPRMAFWYDHNPAHISRRIKDLFEACGIKTQLEIEGKQGTKRHNKSLFSFHSLRFTMGQQLIDSGHSLAQIAQILGHSNETMTMHYSQLSDGVKEKAILSLPSMGVATA